MTTRDSKQEKILNEVQEMKEQIREAYREDIESVDLCANIEQPKSRRGGWTIPRGGLRGGAPAVKLIIVDEQDVITMNDKNGMRKKCQGRGQEMQNYNDCENPDIELPENVPDWANVIKENYDAEKEETEEFIAMAEEFAPCSTDPDQWFKVFPDMPQAGSAG